RKPERTKRPNRAQAWFERLSSACDTRTRYGPASIGARNVAARRAQRGEATRADDQRPRLMIAWRTRDAAENSREKNKTPDQPKRHGSGFRFRAASVHPGSRVA